MNLNSSANFYHCFVSVGKRHAWTVQNCKANTREECYIVSALLAFLHPVKIVLTLVLILTSTKLRIFFSFFDEISVDCMVWLLSFQRSKVYLKTDIFSRLTVIGS